MTILLPDLPKKAQAPAQWDEYKEATRTPRYYEALQERVHERLRAAPPSSPGQRVDAVVFGGHALACFDGSAECRIAPGQSVRATFQQRDFYHLEVEGCRNAEAEHTFALSYQDKDGQWTECGTFRQGRADAVYTCNAKGAIAVALTADRSGHEEGLCMRRVRLH